ncbi:TPA: acyltransferase family protein, partial [Vibrio cholerae]
MNKRFEALDAFRGLCAVCVVIYHIVVVGSFSQWSLFRNSYIFVEFFFVLSGFVLAHGYGFKKGVSFNSFIKGRIIRIYPLHLFMLLAFVGLELLNLLAYNYGFSFRGEPFSGKTSIGELIINTFLLQSWIPSAEALSFNGPSWSISVEFYMYILLFITATFLKGFRFSWLLISLFSFFLLSIPQDLMTNESLRGLSCFFGGAFTYTLFKKFNELSFNFKFGSVIEVFLIAIVLLSVCVEFTYRDFALPVIFMIVVLFF